MRSSHFSLLALFSLSLVPCLAAQTRQSSPPKEDKETQFGKHHQGLFLGITDKAAEAGRTTATFTGSGATLSTEVPRKNYIDEHIFGRMQRDRIPHSPLAGDEVFIRRAYIDATGVLPTADAVRLFLASKDPAKRDKLIDSLIGTDEFAEQWAWFYADLFQASRTPAFSFWLQQWLKLDRPYNEVAAEVVSPPATKSHHMIPTWGAAYWPVYLNTRGIVATDQDNLALLNRLDYLDEVAVNFGRVFLGINMDCVSCHDGAGHTDSLNLYLTTKKRSEFHQQAAFWGRLRPVLAGFGTDNVIMDDSGRGYTTGNDAPYHTGAEGRFPRDGKTYEPAFFLNGEKPRPGMNPRKELGRILTSHVQFSRATVNLIWSKLMVVGFVEPYDGFDLLRLDPNNPPPKPWGLQPTNAWLLDAMARDFKEKNFSIHLLFKTIMKSSAYQLSARFPGKWRDAYAPYYARRFVRVLTGPEVIDALAQATGRPWDFEIMGQPVSRVKQLANPVAVKPRGQTPLRGGEVSGETSSIIGIMQSFYQTTREAPALTTNRPNALQAMLMMSSPVINDRVLAEPNSALRRLLDSGKTDGQVIEEMFLRTLSRFPTAEETEAAMRILGSNRYQGAEDLQWGLLNTSEFLLNH